VEVAEAELERTARRVRRGVRTFRLIFYPGAIVLGALLLTGRGNADGPAFMTGKTSQGAEVTLRLDSGKLTRLFMDIRTRCPADDRWFMWSHEPKLHDERLIVRDVTTRHFASEDRTRRRTVVAHARLDDGELRGSLTATEHWDSPVWGAYDCFSDAVSFSARSG
jgi:hypothetical protein